MTGRARLALLGAVALVAALAVPAGSAESLTEGGGLGGGVVDLATGRVLPGEGLDDGRVTVLPYRAGARYRIPLLLGVAGDSSGVRLLDVRFDPAGSRTVRHAGAVLAQGCCVLDRVAPFAPVTLSPGPGHSPVALVAVDVELCCAPPPASWTERLAGVVVTYRADGVTRMTRVPLPGVQAVVLAA